MQVAKPKKGYKLVKTSFGKYEEIPEEWEVKSLGDVSDVFGGMPAPKMIVVCLIKEQSLLYVCKILGNII